MHATKKQLNATRRARRVRSRLGGRSARIRVSLALSASGMFVQFIDDAKGTTLVSGRDKGFSGTKTERASLLGEALGKKALAEGIKQAALDRGSKKYHGRVKAFTEALRAAGVIV
ncbi:MAG: 50S ribosomal protein L18 [Parcubacteria group bacterium]|nr:50S ribosomal protein L18 [Parcubacteria group bacterium]